jgi:hypothetical protein
MLLMLLLLLLLQASITVAVVSTIWHTMVILTLYNTITR